MQGAGPVSIAVPAQRRTQQARVVWGSRVVTVGGAELSELVRQSTEYAALLRTHKREVRELVLPGDDHFSILDHMARADGVLANAAVALLD